MTTMNPTTETSLATITRETGLAVASANAVILAFGPLYTDAQVLVARAKGLEVKDENDLEGIAAARALRLKLKAIRCDTEGKRKEMKAESLKFGKALDRVAAVVNDTIEPVEKELQEQEQIKERMEAFRKSELKRAREAELVPLGVNTSVYMLGGMKEDEYQTLLAASRDAHEKRQQWAAEESRKRIAEEEAKAAEDARIRAENARLKKEADAAAETARAERSKLEAAAKVAREAQEKAEAELRAQQAATAAKAKAEADAKKKAERAPDKEKLLALADHLRNLELPSATAVEAVVILREVAARGLTCLAHDIEQRAGAL